MDENDQGSDADSSLNKSPIPLGRPSNCPRHFSEFENQCQVEYCQFLFVLVRITCILSGDITFQTFCCTAKIHQFEDPQPDHPPEKKSICKSHIFFVLCFIFSRGYTGTT